VGGNTVIPRKKQKYTTKTVAICIIYIQGAPVKNNQLKFYIFAIVHILKQNLHVLYRRIQVIYAADVVTGGTVCVLIKKLQQFELRSTFYQVNKLLNCDFDVIFQSGTQIRRLFPYLIFSEIYVVFGVIVSHCDIIDWLFAAW